MEIVFNWLQSFWKDSPFRTTLFIAVLLLVFLGKVSDPYITTEGEQRAIQNEKMLVELARDLGLLVVRSENVSVRSNTANSAVIVSKESWDNLEISRFEREVTSRGWSRAGNEAYCMNDMRLSINTNCKECGGIVLDINVGPTAKYKCSAINSVH
jgi:hypothetical protein